MAKKKELPKAQLGSIIRTIKAVGKTLSTGKKIVGSTLSAAKKGYKESVAASKTSKKVKEWPSLDGTPSTKTKMTTSTKAKPVKEPMSPQKKKRIKQATVVGTGAAIAGIKYANRKRRTLND
jgi:hypothetical protein